MKCVVSLLVLAGMAHAEEPRRVFVVNTQGASVSLVDLKEMKELKRAPVGPRPYGVALSQDQKIVAVGVEGERGVRFFDTETLKRRGFVKIGGMKNDHLTLAPDGKHFLLANYHSDSVVAIDAKTWKIAYRIRGLSAPHVVKIGPKRSKAYVTCKKVTGLGVVDLKSRKARFLPLNVNPRSLTFSADESRVYFGSFWVDGFFEVDPSSGRITRLIHLAPPEDNMKPQEVTYHGVERVTDTVILAANEGRSYVDAVDVETGKLLDRLKGLAKPCCVERVPGTSEGPTKALVSNIGDGSVELVGLSAEGKLQSLGKISVGAGPKRVAFLK